MVEVFFDLEVPESKHRPSRRREGLIRSVIALLSARDFRIPVRARLSWCEEVRVAVPEASVDKDGDLASAEREVGLSDDRLGMASPTANAALEELSSECKLGLCVFRANATHDAAAGFWGKEVRQAAQFARLRGHLGQDETGLPTLVDQLVEASHEEVVRRL
jgi:hypothetical protein